VFRAHQQRPSEPGTKAGARFGLDLSTPPMEAKLVPSLPPQDGDWQYEPKWDGFRCLAFKGGDAVELRAKSGKPLGRYFPEIVERLQQLTAAHLVVDGELVIRREGRLDFDALQMRLHPAETRIHKLSRETPAELIAFDLLVDPKAGSILDRPLSMRRKLLEALAKRSAKAFLLSPATRDHREAIKWLAGGSHGDTDGVIAKRLDGPYAPGERAMLKVKRIRTADCVVGGFRYSARERKVGSLLLGLYDNEGLLHHVGFTSALSNEDKAALTRRLEGLRTTVSFTGRAPGGPSRWSTERTGDWQAVKPKLVVEVRYDHVTDDRFRHGTTLVRWRPDKAPSQCTFDQLRG
jgi:ATP-dependent DNA ligase